MNAMRWLEVPVQPPSQGNGSPAPKYGTGNAVVVYGTDSAYVGTADAETVRTLTSHPDVRLLSPDDLRTIEPFPGLPLTWESLENQVPGRGGHHHRRGRAIGLGDVISAITRRAGIPECGGCARRRTGLNRIVVWGWWRERPAHA